MARVHVSLPDALRGRSAWFRLVALFYATSVGLGVHGLLGDGPTLPSEFVYTVIVGATVLTRAALPDEDDRQVPLRNLGYGALAVFVGLYLAVTGFPLPLAVAIGIVGGWGVLDGVQGLRHGPPDTGDEGGSPSDHGRAPHETRADRIEDLLGDRPLTRREIRDAFDRYPDRTDAALSHLEATGRIERRGSAYRVPDPASPGVVARLRARSAAAVDDWVRGPLARAARPLTVEFRRDETGDGRDSTEAAPERGASDARSRTWVDRGVEPNPGDERESRSDAGPGRDRDPERA